MTDYATSIELRKLKDQLNSLKDDKKITMPNHLGRALASDKRCRELEGALIEATRWNWLDQDVNDCAPEWLQDLIAEIRGNEMDNVAKLDAYASKQALQGQEDE